MQNKTSLSRRESLKLIGCAASSRMMFGSSVAAAEKNLTNRDSVGLRAEDGVYLREGRQVRALGVNYFDCFTRTLVENRTESEEAFERCDVSFRELSKLGIPFLRFNAGGFYPKDWQYYEREPEDYFAKLERLVQLAEAHGLGLIPSLFWSFFTQPGRASEPLAAWGEDNSQTHKLMRRYVDEVVGRFQNSSAVWAWEFGNEYNLEIDLPNQRELLKRWYQTSLGMPAEPGPRDVLGSREMLVALKSFAAAVRARDPDRVLFTGNACPRSAAWHLDQEGTWTADTRDQWCAAFEKQNPCAFGGLSMHFYPFHEGDGTGLAGSPHEATLEAAAAVAAHTGKPLWVGEFGPAPSADPTTRLKQFQTILGWMERQNVTLAAAWVYDYPAQPGNNLASAANRPLLEALSEACAHWATK